MKFEYGDKMILINRLEEFISEFHWIRDWYEDVSLHDITEAVNQSLEEVTQTHSEAKGFFDTSCSKEWHIRRVIYFINHPEEICDIQVGHEFYYDNVYVQPNIMDGNHRLMAAMWLRRQGKIDKICCQYRGRQDVLEYLTGNTDSCPS